MPSQGELLQALEAVKGRVVELLFFGEGVFTEKGENGFSIRSVWPTDKGVLVDLSPEISQASRGYVGYTLLKVYDIDRFFSTGELDFEAGARAVEFMRCTAYLEGRPDHNMFIDFRRSERLEGGQVQYGEFNSLAQVYSRNKVRTDDPALAVRVIA